MMCKYFPETLKHHKPSPEVGETGALKTVPATDDGGFWAAQKRSRRGGQRWFDHHFRPIRVFSGETKKKEMKCDVHTTT